MNNQMNMPKSVKILSIISLVTGISSVAFFFGYGLYIVAGIGAIVTSVIAKNKAADVDYGKFSKFIKAGMITGIIGVILNFLFILLEIFIIAANV